MTWILFDGFWQGFVTIVEPHGLKIVTVCGMYSALPRNFDDDLQVFRNKSFSLLVLQLVF